MHKKSQKSISYGHEERRIPRGYNIDTMVIMPVNADTSFIYWEITDRLLHNYQKKLKKGSGRLMIRVFDADRLKEVCSFEIKEMIGKNYINYQPPMRPLTAEIGIRNGRGFKRLLSSGNTSASSPWTVSSRASGSGKQKKNPCPAHEIWMTGTDRSRKTVILPDSNSRVKHIRLLEYYLQAAEQPKSFSSAELTEFFR